MVNNFEISLVVLMPNITTKHAITYTNHSMVCFFKVHNPYTLIHLHIKVNIVLQYYQQALTGHFSLMKKNCCLEDQNQHDVDCLKQ